MENKYSTIKIVFNDDQEIFRKGVVEIIKANPEFELIATIKSCHDLIPIVENKLPDVVITAVQTKDTEDAITITKTLTDRFPHIGVLVISMFQQEQNIIKMLEAGAKGCLLRSAASNELVEAIKTVHRLDTYYSPQIIGKLGNLIADQHFIRFGLKNAAVLNNTDKMLLSLLCREYTMKEIATHFDISVRTVEHRKEKLYLILGKKNIAGLINYAIQSGLYSPYDSK